MFMEAPGLNTVSDTYAVAFDPFTPAAAAGAPIAIASMPPLNDLKKRSQVGFALVADVAALPARPGARAAPHARRRRTGGWGIGRLHSGDAASGRDMAETDQSEEGVRATRGADKLCACSGPWRTV